MNVLVLGSGGREHAMAWKIKQSSFCDELFVAPGNGGTLEIATNLNLNIKDFNEVKSAVKKHQIDMVVVGPEEPLVLGITDFLKSQEDLEDLLIIGPDSLGAQLEGSKQFAKDFMNKYQIPTAKAAYFDEKNLEEGYRFLEEDVQAPYVLKADGLAAGKGVIITSNLQEAKDTLKELIQGKKFGEASAKVLIEEFLAGIEVSVFVVTDGSDYLILPEAKDYKNIGEGNTGLNTGGMGAVSPVIFADRIFMEKVESRIIKPTVAGIGKEGMDFKGFIFIGLMNKGGEPYVIEYNVRMGDPETEAVLPRIKSDFLEILSATAKGKLDSASIEFEPFTAATVMLVSGGYPEHYEKGKEIAFKSDLKNVVTFHAGTLKENDVLLTNGGRVITVTALGKNMGEAVSKSYQSIQDIKFEGMYYRKDIGFDLQELGQ